MTLFDTHTQKKSIFYAKDKSHKKEEEILKRYYSTSFTSVPCVWAALSVLQIPTSTIASRASVKPWHHWNTPLVPPPSALKRKPLEPKNVWGGQAKRFIHANFLSLATELTRNSFVDIHYLPRDKLNWLLWNHLHKCAPPFIWDQTTGNGLIEAIMFYVSVFF